MISVVTSRSQPTAEKRAFLFELWRQKTLVNDVVERRQIVRPVIISADQKEMVEIQAIIDKFSNPEADRIVLDKLL